MGFYAQNNKKNNIAGLRKVAELKKKSDWIKLFLYSKLWRIFIDNWYVAQNFLDRYIE